MGLACNLIMNTISIAIIIIIFAHCSKRDKVVTLQSKIYMIMLLVTILLLVLDIFSRFDGNPYTIYPFLNHIGNFLVFMLNPVLPSLWLLYVHVRVYQEKDKTKRLLYLLLAVNGCGSVNSVNVFWMVLLHRFREYLPQRSVLFFLSVTYLCTDFYSHRHTYSQS